MTVMPSSGGSYLRDAEGQLARQSPDPAPAPEAAMPAVAPEPEQGIAAPSTARKGSK